MQRLKLIYTALILSILFLSSCTTPLKEITYLHNLQESDSTVMMPPTKQYKISKNDNLYISFITENQQTTDFLNLSQPGQNITSEASLELVTYVVDSQGNIHLPYLGDIHAEGKTIEELRTQLQNRINQVINNSSVVVKLVNRTITVLGDVESPGQYNMLKNSMTIFQALGEAGDLNDFGNRKKIRLIRKTDGKQNIVTLDLTDSRILTSAYYLVQPNDVIYVPPKHRVYGAKTLPFTTVFSTISTAVLLYNAMKK
ncbi:polysaccharide biosynthesis/export family protein [Prolixibacter bellariivorans]|nr:polysaccharide biosynthesis/export family protein [Prolixibacter bellariivorans]